MTDSTPTTTPGTAAPPPDSLLDAVKRDPNFVPARDGIEAFGLYTEIVRFNRASGRMVSHVRYFVLENAISIYVRENGKKAGRWATTYVADHAAAKERLINSITSLDNPVHTAIVRGNPQLVQVTVADLVAVRAKDKHGPDSRWRGINKIDGALGKLDDTVTLSDMAASS